MFDDYGWIIQESLGYDEGLVSEMIANEDQPLLVGGHDQQGGSYKKDLDESLD